MPTLRRKPPDMDHPVPPESAASEASSAPAEHGRAPHPCGPILFRAPHATRTARWCGLLGLLAIGLVILALWRVEPRPEGIGTHTQLGLPPCSWPVQWGIPCPTCGMTTALALVVRGHWLRAAGAHALGPILGVVLLLLLANAAVSLATGRPWRINPFRLSGARLVLLAFLAVIAAWMARLLATSGLFG